MHLTHSRMLLYSITCMLTPLLLTIYLNLLLLCLKCLKIFAYHFLLPGPSYFPILFWPLTTLDCVLHKYFIWVKIPSLSEFLSWACPEFSRRSEYERAWVPLLTLHLFHFLLFSLTDFIWISLWAQVQDFWVAGSWAEDLGAPGVCKQWGHPIRYLSDLCQWL